MVFVSLKNLLPLIETDFHSIFLAKGDKPSSVGRYESTSGNSTGRSFSSTAFIPASECKIGIGSPQYLCLVNIQSLSL